MKRLVPKQLQELIDANIADHPELVESLGSFRDSLDDAQVFDFGKIEHIDPTDRTLTCELWNKGLLRMPFRHCVFTFVQQGIRLYQVVLDRIEITSGDHEPVIDATGMVIAQQRDDGYSKLDGLTWFKVPDGEHVMSGGSPLSDCDDETPASFRSYCLAHVSRIMTLCMLLNTKGVPRKHEPAPVRLNAKRARSGKPPISAITYVDLSKVSSGSSHVGHGSPKSMHLRRGHIRHYDDGSVTWVRDCIVKADGELKQRERYQLREKRE